MSSEEPVVGICHVGSPSIRAMSKPIKSQAQAAKICQILTSKLRELKGAGLAAPQIGLPYRIFVIEVKKTDLFPEREETPLYTVINPTIEFLTSKEVYDFEGCFSVPGYVGHVPRAWSLHMKWTDQDGVEHSQDFEGYLARVIQHEFDHLNGLVYLDRMQDMKTFITREHYMQRCMEDRCMTLRVVSPQEPELN